jgi:hypothetical protein
MRWAGNVALLGDKRNSCSILIGKPERKKLLRRPRHGLEDNIRLVFKDIGLESVDWMLLAHDRS